jgi:hypothetical protein
MIRCFETLEVLEAENNSVHPAFLGTAIVAHYAPRSIEHQKAKVNIVTLIFKLHLILVSTDPSMFVYTLQLFDYRLPTLYVISKSEHQEINRQE